MIEAPVMPRPPAVKRPGRLTEIYYPESDGKPVGETEFHVIALLGLLQTLRSYYRLNDHVYVGGDMLFYYVEGKPSEFKVPDVFVVKGIGKHMRRTYKLWEEQIAPCVIFEITSRGTRREDFGTKRSLYQRLGVQEYFLFDPMAEYLRPPLQGFTLVAGSYQPLTPQEDGSIWSQELGLELRAEGVTLRLFDRSANKPLPTMDEAVSQMEDAIELAQSAVQRADIADQWAQAEAQRAQAEVQRAQAAAQRAQAEAQRAQAEAQRAAEAEARTAEAEAEIERLRRMLDELRQP
jgi:Uma2 family endonuclease